MTGASLNLLSLQCWASTVSHNLRVVEPFLLPGGSKFGTLLTDEKQKDTSNPKSKQNVVRLRDIQDIVMWERETNKRGFSPLISWNQFVEHAPPNLIAVRRRCLGDININCASAETKFNSSLRSFSKALGFKIIRYVHLKQEAYSSVNFRRSIYGNYSAGDTVVLFSNWGGIYSSPEPKSYRIGIPEAKRCLRHSFMTFPLHVSQQIQRDSERYLEQYLPGTQSKGYIGVMFRSERFALNHGFQSMTSANKKLSLLTGCVEAISSYVNNFKKQFGIEAVFLAMDCRKQGSKVFRRQAGPDYIMNRHLFDKVSSLLFQSLFGNSSSLKKWDDSFDDIATFKSAGYLAQLQKYLAAQASCLLTAGGGGFQQSAVHLYNESHWQLPSRKYCVVEVPQCL